LCEIGHEFGGRHHTTVLHAINNIEAMSRSDEALNSAITRLVDAFAERIRVFPAPSFLNSLPQF
jgi:chromosomal replication initiator protein